MICPRSRPTCKQTFSNMYINVNLHVHTPLTTLTSQVKAHLQADLGYQSKLVRFLENHDEERAAESWKDTRQAFFFSFSYFFPSFTRSVQEGLSPGTCLCVCTRALYFRFFSPSFLGHGLWLDTRQNMAAAVISFRTWRPLLFRSRFPACISSTTASRHVFLLFMNIYIFKYIIYLL